MRSINPRVFTRRMPKVHMETATVMDRRRSSQTYISTDNRGSRRSSAEHERVRKWEGLLRTEGSDEM
jgi:hypothetical protein